MVITRLEALMSDVLYNTDFKKEDDAYVGNVSCARSGCNWKQYCCAVKKATILDLAWAAWLKHDCKGVG